MTVQHRVMDVAALVTALLLAGVSLDSVSARIGPQPSKNCSIISMGTAYSGTPAARRVKNGEKVAMKFMYTANRYASIQAIPYYQGRPVSNYSTSPSIVGMTYGLMNGQSSFTVTKGTVKVDTVRVVMTGTDKNELAKLDMKVNLEFGPPLPVMSTEYSTDRPGSDYKKVYKKGVTAAYCKDLCLKEEKCRAYTWVEQSVFRQKYNTCFLKSSVPKKVSRLKMVSGVKEVK